MEEDGGVRKEMGRRSAHSSIRRIFGEYVSVKAFVNMTKEAAVKGPLYGLFVRMTSHDGGRG